MDGIGQALSSFFSNPNTGKAISGGLLGAGEIGNIMEERKRMAYQNFVMDLLKNPQKLAQMAAKIQAPLDNGLVQATNNRVQGDMASRGLSQAPGIFAASESQALAPYIQQNQSTALQAVMQSLGLPQGTFQQPQNLGPLMGTFLKSFTPNSSTPTAGLTPQTGIGPGDTGDVMAYS
jgi:hypothetical protein